MVQCASDHLSDYQKMARALRAEEIGVEVFPGAKNIGQQLQYAERRGFKLALIAGPDEFAKGVWKIKDLARREETMVDAAEVVSHLRTMTNDESRMTRELRSPKSNDEKARTTRLRRYDSRFVIWYSSFFRHS